MLSRETKVMPLHRKKRTSLGTAGERWKMSVVLVPWIGTKAGRGRTGREETRYPWKNMCSIYGLLLPRMHNYYTRNMTLAAW